ncbi:cytochrome-c peroxidase [Runella slithyformis]|uniref:Di-heme cytochrome c peroxidase n=1 Tax=Runella slithyformis (strain ATCC 29530 / DSM 19594 / LMG 11500 / NCIMB 11436 / LSU 4) TaxID=761193 RepID=A0A7U4E5K6_RUNSL|nr:cytochrome c peroxidase [Runella slithyformis]AEI48686.1 Di-heme cytochrome c peroxidase [Runella slithyformis DSM 19594]
MKNNLIHSLAFVLALISLSGCQKEELATEFAESSPQTMRMSTTVPVLPATPFNYATVTLPTYLNTPPIRNQINTPANNPITDQGAALGRVLFYDKNLSFNNTTSCASCHHQSNSFSDTLRFSKGFAGGLTTRNSMSLLNARYYPNGRFFWDERAASAEIQASRPIVHTVEMGMSMPGAVAKLKTLGYYPGLFQNAYGTTTIDSAGIAKALAQFIRSMVSYRTKYDIGRAALTNNQTPENTDFTNFTALENQGKQLFFTRGNCGTCHGTETFTAPEARNNGLDLVSTDNGVGAVTGNRNANALFKVPSLRGIEKSAPYMHDGRFATLEQVVEHYNSQVKPHVNLSRQLRDPNGQPRRLNLTAEQKNALVAFLKTLTDTGIATDPKFSDPFK